MFTGEWGEMPVTGATPKRATSSTVAVLAALTLGVAGMAAPAQADDSTAPAKNHSAAGTELQKPSLSGAKTALATNWYHIVTYPFPGSAGWFMTISGARTDPGAPVIGWELTTGAQSEAWTIYKVGTSPYYVIRSGNTSSWYALAISGGSKTVGAPAIQWNFEVTSAPAHLEQQWQFVSVGTQGRVELKNANSGLCLTTRDAKGAGMTQQRCDYANPLQLFDTNSTWY
jgi:ricin-type beta-trefoil lectin protein